MKSSKVLSNDMVKRNEVMAAGGESLVYSLHDGSKGNSGLLFRNP